MIEITPDLSIPETEIQLYASRSSGPGGQNVNKVASRMTLEFDLRGSSSLNEEQRARLEERLASRLTKDGVLQLSSQRHRTQQGNREDVLERFVEILRSALAEVKPRKKTRLPRKAKEKRLQEKKVRGEIKRHRTSVKIT